MKRQEDSNLINFVKDKFISLQLLNMTSDVRLTIEPYLISVVNKKIIPYESMRDYCIVKLHEKYLIANKQSVKDTLIDLEIDFEVSSRQIRRILQKNRLF
jgi:hypothetical protein